MFSPRDTTLFPLRIEEVRVRQGDTVEAGTVLLILKTASGKTLAMRSPLAGTVTQIAAGVGDSLANPRALVVIAEVNDGVVDGEWEEAAGHPSPPPGDAAAESTDRAGPDTASDLPPRRDSGNRRGPFIGIAAALVALALAYPLFGEDLLQALSTTGASPRATTSRTSSDAAAASASAGPASYTGPLSEAVMSARDFGDQRLGWIDAPRFVGLGVLRIERGDRSPLDCAAVAVSDRFAAISTMCYEPAIAEYGEQGDMRMSFQALRPIVARDERGERGEVPGFSRLHRLDVKALHVWPGYLGDTDTATIALAEFAAPAPKAIGRSGFWRISETSAPPVLALHGMSLRTPDRFRRKALVCRYWLPEDADAPDARQSLPLSADPACGPDTGPRSGPIRAPHDNGKMYFAGFSTSQRRAGKTIRHARSLSHGDLQLLRAAKDGTDLPRNRMTVRPMKRLDTRGPGMGIRLSNPCKENAEFRMLGYNMLSDKKNMRTYRVRPGPLPGVEALFDPSFNSVAVNQIGRERIWGTQRQTFKDRSYELVPFKNKTGMEIQVTAVCG
ncbi:hypothetical protein [Stappia sp. ES.058]|uniref:hypothetical protein n=1 Tax=Stappia sp. ES.058 TaxID=1881061 RepID=UPI0012FE15F3|nr:hypothetical protein [Stappia sp. ES.058]